MSTATLPTVTKSLRALAPPSHPGQFPAFFALISRRLSLSLRTPRAILLPLATPVLIAVVIAPALAKSTGRVSGIDYMTYLAIGTAALVVPLS